MRLVCGFLFLFVGTGPAVVTKATYFRKAEAKNSERPLLDSHEKTRKLPLRKEDYLKDFRNTVKTKAPTWSPTSSPTLASPGRQFSRQEVQDYVIRTGITAQETFDDEITPQSQASFWLAEFDPSNVRLPTDDVDDYHFVTRYILTTIYFALGGPTTWRFQFNFLTDNDICQWQDTFTSEGGDRFQYGVGCGSTGEIETLVLGMVPHKWLVHIFVSFTMQCRII